MLLVKDLFEASEFHLEKKGYVILNQGTLELPVFDLPVEKSIKKIQFELFTDKVMASIKISLLIEGNDPLVVCDRKIPYDCKINYQIKGRWEEIIEQFVDEQIQLKNNQGKQKLANFESELNKEKEKEQFYLENF